MSRYARMFDRLKVRSEGALGAFLMLGDPNLETSASLLDAVVEAGADMIEVGIPFSDPIADGPVIQAAGKRALKCGVGVGDCFGLIADFRRRHQDVPIGILTYANLIVAGTGFMRRAAAAGADSLLIADVPALEAEPFVGEMSPSGARAGADRGGKHARGNPLEDCPPVARLHLLCQPIGDHWNPCGRRVRSLPGFTAQ